MKVNGTRLGGFSSPSSYLTLDRTWNGGDRVDVSLPMSLRIESMPDDKTIQAAMYGPLVLAGRLGTEGLTKSMFYSESETSPRGDPIQAPVISTGPSESGGWLKPVSGDSLTFQTTGQAHDHHPRTALQAVWRAVRGLLENCMHCSLMNLNGRERLRVRGIPSLNALPATVSARAPCRMVGDSKTVRALTSTVCRNRKLRFHAPR